MNEKRQRTIKISAKAALLADELAIKHDVSRSMLIYVLLRMCKEDSSFLRIYGSNGEEMGKGSYAKKKTKRA